jgi:predicted N-acetyltransferase YhbS
MNTSEAAAPPPAQAGRAVEFVEDDQVDAELDRQLRDLLSVCFTKPGDHVFMERRYFRQLPQHRWIIRHDRGSLDAHVAVHDRVVTGPDGDFRIGGIAEVCVRPGHRGCGLVRAMLAAVHTWLREQGVPFAMLFGNPAVYSSSGYRPADNVYCLADENGVRVRKQACGALVRATGDRPWPDGDVDINGLTF